MVRLGGLDPFVEPLSTWIRPVPEAPRPAPTIVRRQGPAVSVAFDSHDAGVTLTRWWMPDYLAVPTFTRNSPQVPRLLRR